AGASHERGPSSCAGRSHLPCRRLMTRTDRADTVIYLIPLRVDFTTIEPSRLDANAQYRSSARARAIRNPDKYVRDRHYVCAHSVGTDKDTKSFEARRPY